MRIRLTHVLWRRGPGDEVALEFAADHAGEVTFEIALESAGEMGFTTS